jgi:hypothetical protein
MAVDKWQRHRGEKGNIAVIAAVSLTALIGMLALVVDGGYLYSAKNRYQNAVEAAALAGAHHFSDGYDEDGLPLALKIAGDIAVENGVPSGAVATEVGFYDEAAGHFEPDPDPITDWNEAISIEEEPIYNTAVMVTAEDDVSTFLAGIFGRDTVTVSAKAVAYGKRYTFLATGTEAGHTGLDLDGRWDPGFVVYRQCILGSNGPVLFYGDDYETFEGTWVETTDEVSGADGKVEVIELSKQLEAPAIDWDALRAQAEENGVVYTTGDLDGWTEEWQTDAYGNNYKCTPASWRNHYTTHYYFLPAGRDDNDPTNSAHEGDHQGRTYFFEIPEDPPEGVEGYLLKIVNDRDTQDIKPPPCDRTCWNFTVAARCEFSSLPNAPYECCTTLGNVPELGDQGIVYMYCKNTSSRWRGWYTDYSGAYQTILQPKGVVFHLEDDFRMETQNWLQEIGGPFYLRCYADKIEIFDNYPGGSELIFDGAFGPLDNIKLGRLGTEEG